jgi:hypothetical protein
MKNTLIIGESWPIERNEKDGKVVFESYFPNENKFDFSEIEGIQLRNFTDIHNLYMDSLDEVITVLLFQILKREPIAEDLKGLKLIGDQVEPMTSYIYWDETLIGTIKQWKPEIQGNSCLFPGVTFTPVK